MGQVALLDKENKAKEEQLKQDGLLKWILIACLIITSLSGIIYKNLELKRKNENWRTATSKQNFSNMYPKWKCKPSSTNEPAFYFQLPKFN
jgi:hypothetical protein